MRGKLGGGRGGESGESDVIESGEMRGNVMSDPKCDTSSAEM